MTRRSHSGPLVAGLILIAIGVIFLLENWYGYASFWRLFARYWPVILILVGLNKLYGYFTWQEVHPLPEPVDKEQSHG